MKKDQSTFIREHAAESLNFQISLTIWLIISALLLFVVIGIVGLIALPIMSLICCIIGAIKAADGQPYRYPLTIRFVN